MTMEEEKKNKGILIGGFKAIGKSTLAKKYSNVIDLESSNFEYIIDEKLMHLSVEERKGLKSRVKNPEYPLNYYKELISLLEDGNIVLFACKSEVVQLLEDNHIDYRIVYPKEDMLDEIVERSIARGNNPDFVSRIKKVYYDDLPKNSEKVIWIEKGQYLEDVLHREEIL